METEIEHLENYLQIEKVQLAKRLVYELRIDPHAKSFPLLVMSVFPLIKNAVKHGVENQLGKVKIMFHAWVESQRLHILVENPIPEDEPKVGRGEQLGLLVLQRRLELVYNRNDLLSIKRDEKKFVAELVLPPKASF